MGLTTQTVLEKLAKNGRVPYRTCRICKTELCFIPSKSGIQLQSCKCRPDGVVAFIKIAANELSALLEK